MPSNANQITIAVSGPQYSCQAVIVKLLYELLKDQFDHITVPAPNLLGLSLDQLLVKIDEIKDHTTLSIVGENTAVANSQPRHNPAPPPGYHQYGTFTTGTGSIQ